MVYLETLCTFTQTCKKYKSFINPAEFQKYQSSSSTSTILIMTTQDFLTALSSAYWEIDYYKFLKMTGFVDSQYSLEKFKLFQQSAKGLTQFDAKTLESLINTETKKTAEAASV
ncbi:hypothetical protein [Nostoc sp. NMS8]|uniref:hypothetical protein n=2 Tax=Nostoc TaxID=1177 RepID=UPI0025E504F0|nr:hypothetical protein [Nostoc sp. NMS8]